VLKRDVSKTDSVVVVFAGVTLSANAIPRSINSSGNDTSIIRVVLTDAMGNPIPGEPMNFTPQQDSTEIVEASPVTDNRGEAYCKLVGTGVGSDTITVVAAGATAKPVIYYSSNFLTIAPDTGQSLVADGTDSTWITIRYREGDQTTPIPGASVKVSVTLGDLGVVFAENLTTNATGRARFWMRNPTFANTATISAEARDGDEITTAEHKLYFGANRVHWIDLTVTPEVISTNGDRAKITAVAYDSLYNRVKDAHVAFNLLEGPGGGEYLDPPTAITNSEGIATSHLISGNVPSMYHEVELVAGDFTAVKSDTVRLTIAGPARYITVRTNILTGVDYKDGTFGLPCAAIVSDINMNPVADGTEVTFSAQISGYVVWWYSVRWYFDDVVYWWWDLDTTMEVLPFEDYNDNYRLDPDEDRNHDGVLNRGEDVNGDGLYYTGPGFEDINHSGYRDKCPGPEDSTSICPEPYRIYSRWRSRALIDSLTGDTTGWENYLDADTAYMDYNGNGALDTIEPLLDPAYKNMTWTEYTAWRDTAAGGLGFDLDYDKNGVADPSTAVSIKRTVQTEGGKATNEILYGQSDANKIQVMISAEAQGVRCLSPEIVILPIIY
jgi:hypothetical protein